MSVCVGWWVYASQVDASAVAWGPGVGPLPLPLNTRTDSVVCDTSKSNEVKLATARHSFVSSALPCYLGFSSAK